MTAFGDAAEWAKKFKSFDVLFLECVAAVWPECCSRLQNQPLEDQITTNLVYLLAKNQLVRQRFHWIEYQYEPFGETSGERAYSRGKVDIAVFLDRERGRYIAYECKRLNVESGGSIRSLAAQYVMEGMNRFVTEQYAENLPVGCMLGYVMNGKVLAARSRIYAAIKSRENLIGLIKGPVKEKPLGEAKRFSSLHIRTGSGAEIEIRHALLPFLNVV